MIVEVIIIISFCHLLLQWFDGTQLRNEPNNRFMHQTHDVNMTVNYTLNYFS